MSWSQTLILAAAVLAGGSSLVGADPLERHRWSSRLLVVIAPGERDPRLVLQRRLFQEARAGNRDRNLVLVEGVASSAAAVGLRRRFGIGTDEFRAILVGKDGGEKLASPTPLTPQQLFTEIDTMPMRRIEMGGSAAGTVR